MNVTQTTLVTKKVYFLNTVWMSQFDLFNITFWEQNILFDIRLVRVNRRTSTMEEEEAFRGQVYSGFYAGGM